MTFAVVSGFDKLKGLSQHKRFCHFVISSCFCEFSVEYRSRAEEVINATVSMYLNSDEMVEWLLQVTDALLSLVSSETLSKISVSTKCVLNNNTNPQLLALFLRKKASIPSCMVNGMRIMA